MKREEKRLFHQEKHHISFCCKWPGTPIYTYFAAPNLSPELRGWSKNKAWVGSSLV